MKSTRETPLRDFLNTVSSESKFKITKKREENKKRAQTIQAVT